MHKIVALYPPQPDPEGFKAYYTNTHIPLARKLPGLLALRYTFQVQGLTGAAPYFCIFEADFPDAATALAAMGSPAGQEVAADVPKLTQHPPTLVHYSVQS